MKPDIWKRIESRQVADCRVFRIREDVCRRDGEKEAEHNFFVIENPDWVNIIGLTKDQEVVLIEQFRHGTEEIILEIPGGMLDEGEDPERAARREMAEETGFEADDFVYLGKSRPNPAIQNNTIYHFLARNCEKRSETSFDEHESVITRLVPYEEIKKLVAEGRITHALAVTGFYYLALHLEKL
ncbi:MAG: NUDIX hydrolase [Pyrinomonadaceae bacterium]